MWPLLQAVNTMQDLICAEFFYLLLISQGSLCARSHGTMLTTHGIIKILDTPNQLRRHLERYRLATLSVCSQGYGLDRDGGIYVC